MKIVSWNCAGALRKKLSVLDCFDADLYIVQECEDPLQSIAEYKDWAGNYLWTGDNKNRGIGIFPKKGNSVQPLDWKGTHRIQGIYPGHKSASWSTDDLKLFLPFSLNQTLNIVAAWTKGSDSQAFGYIGQLWKYIQLHGTELARPNTILIGDLNSNAIWDRDDRWWSHSGVVAELEELGLVSKYHAQTYEPKGMERTSTFYMHRKPDKGYHIDYAFLSKQLLDLSKLQIGSPGQWLEYSDHIPLELNLKI